MGQARARKKNGTYPTKEQIAQMELDRLRNDITRPYILSPDELKLPDVPEQAREDVRAFLAPLLQHVPVKNGDCWNIAQTLMLAANTPRVGYVEGVWTNPEHHREHERNECDCECYSKEKMFGSPHAWNTVDGYLVDLSVENKFRGWNPEWPLDDWWHEPLQKHTHAQFCEYVEDDLLDGCDIASILAVDYNSQEEIFQPASGRLEARYLARYAVKAEVA